MDEELTASTSTLRGGPLGTGRTPWDKTKGQDHSDHLLQANSRESSLEKKNEKKYSKGSITSIERHQYFNDGKEKKKTPISIWPNVLKDIKKWKLWIQNMEYKM